MCLVDNKVIETPIITIIERLKNELESRHVYKLSHIEVKQNNIRITCPFHKDGQETTPSCEILTEDKGCIPKGTVHCFGCGYKSNLVKFISDCLGINYRGATEWLLDNASYSHIQPTREIDMLDEIDCPNKPIITPIVPLNELRQYDYIHDYMFHRKLTYDIIDKFEVGYDPNTNSLTFPVYNNGVCEIIVRRNVGYKGFSMPKMDRKPIYGLDYINPNEDVIVCESIIDALTCWVYGKQAIALLGTGSQNNYDDLNKLSIRSYTLMFDGDDAGRNGTYRFKKNIKNAIIFEVEMPHGKDINDLNREEFLRLYASSNI